MVQIALVRSCQLELAIDSSNRAKSSASRTKRISRYPLDQSNKLCCNSNYSPEQDAHRCLLVRPTLSAASRVAILPTPESDTKCSDVAPAGTKALHADITHRQVWSVCSREVLRYRVRGRLPCLTRQPCSRPPTVYDTYYTASHESTSYCHNGGSHSVFRTYGSVAPTWLTYTREPWIRW